MTALLMTILKFQYVCQRVFIHKVERQRFLEILFCLKKITKVVYLKNNILYRRKVSYHFLQQALKCLRSACLIVVDVKVCCIKVKWDGLAKFSRTFLVKK